MSTDPSLVAFFDQAHAAFGAELGILVQVYNGMRPGSGEGQSVANLVAFFAKQYPEIEVRALLANAVQRLAEADRPAVSPTVFHLTEDQLCALRELLGLVHYDDLANEWLNLLPREFHPTKRGSERVDVDAIVAGLLGGAR